MKKLNGWYRYHKDGYIDEDILKEIHDKQTQGLYYLLSIGITVLILSFAVSCLFW